MFKQVKDALKNNFASMQNQTLFYVAIDRDEIWNQYLDGFDDPEIRQQHNCNACKSFLRQWGGIVAINDDFTIRSVWDGIEVEGFEKAIGNIRRYVHTRPITDVFYNDFASIGTDKNYDKEADVMWEHFHLQLPNQFVIKRNIESKRAELRTNQSVFKRALDEISIDAIETVMELIAQGSLYRGNENSTVLSAFLVFRKDYENVPRELRDNYAWAKMTIVHNSVSHIRNTSIGTLLVDLSQGRDLDAAVTAFERIVAPTNYKRPTALVTPRMVEDAKAKLIEMGVMGSLERRYANEADLSLENVLFTDKSSSVKDVFEEIAQEGPVNPRSLSKVEEVSIEDFIEKIVPKAKTIELLLENRHTPNLVTLLTSQDKDAADIFKWNNPFSWSYTGGITDSIKERVKAAGGRTDSPLRISLSWNNYDDLDLHVVEPDSTHIYFRSYKAPSTSPNSGQLDVDMNAGSGHTRTPVENIAWLDSSKMKNGTYKVYVNQYSQRELSNQGFTIQIEALGETFEFSYSKNPTSDSDAIIFDFNKETGATFKDNIKSNTASKEVWNMKTNTFIRVKKMMLSPNYWNGHPTGNKHYFFFLENAVSDEDARPFFNEFLKSEFDTNRKVFEVLGSKLRVEKTSNQLSGVGFSETQRNDVIVRVDSNFKRLIKIKI